MSRRSREQTAETNAWRNDIVAEFKRLGIDVSNETWEVVLRGIAFWGETLVALRVEQAPDAILRAFENATIDLEAARERIQP